MTHSFALPQASVLIFVWPGSAAQIGAGFLITLGSLLMALAVRPFEDRELGFMHSFSLIVQAITLYSGIMLLTQRWVLSSSHHCSGIVSHFCRCRPCSGGTPSS